MSTFTLRPGEFARGHLTDTQLARLDDVLESHGYPKSTPFSVPERLAKVCLECGSIAEAVDQETRDFCVENFDMRCCGDTVIFHSSQRVLVDPSKLTIIRKV